MSVAVAIKRSERKPLRPFLTALSLLWLSGAALRMTVLAVPPLLLVLPLGGSWREAIALWSVPILVVALLVTQFGAHPAAALPGAAQRPRWWPDWGDPRIWKLGFLFGGVNSIYFTTNAFLPEYL